MGFVPIPTLLMLPFSSFINPLAMVAVMCLINSLVSDTVDHSGFTLTGSSHINGSIRLLTSFLIISGI